MYMKLRTMFCGMFYVMYKLLTDIRMMKAINKEWYTTCVQKGDVEVQGTHPPCESS
jgi:hypothetical protein